MLSYLPLRAGFRVRQKAMGRTRLKECNTCKELLPYDMFNKSKKHSDGHNHKCRSCVQEYNREWRDKNRDAILAKEKEWRDKNREEIARKHKEWRHKNPEKIRAIQRRYYDNIRAKRRAWWAKYNAAKLERTPPWADLETIERFYEGCPEGYHVDHIIPLQGETVSGLHVLDNLQYLPAEENLRKGNKYEN